MTRSLSVLLTGILLITALAVPMGGAVSAVTPTTTTAWLTTTTAWLCDTTTAPETTTTTYVLTGPDGTNPDNTTTVPTTTSTEWLPDCNSTTVPLTTTTMPDGAIEMLSTSSVETTDTISVLAGPTEGHGLFADCYSYDGGIITVTPSNGGAYPFSSYRFLHLTVRANTGFAITYFDDVAGISHDSEAVIAQAIGDGTGWIPAGGYRIVLDLEELYITLAQEEATNITVSRLYFTMQAPGSISIGHVELSDQYTCTAEIPDIQTTTKPSFPWDTTAVTTVTTTTTTNSNCMDWDGDGLCDVCGDPVTTRPTTTTVSTSTVVTTVTTTTTTNSNCMDWDGDGLCDVCGDPVTTRPTTTTGPTSATPIISSTTGNPTTGDVLVPGDMDGDAHLSMTDAFTLYRGIATGEWSGDQYFLADYTGDGVVDIRDAFALYRLVSGA